MKNLKDKEGITLLALVITIVVLLILATITIEVISDDGIITKVRQARQNHTVVVEEEETKLNTFIDNIEKNTIELITKEESYVGCYADVDGDKIADGIIYADLAHSVSGHWENAYLATFSYTGITEGLKDYYISGSYTGVFYDDAKDVISIAPGTTGKDRFYVMALKDITTEKYRHFSWYKNAKGLITDYSTLTLGGFGEGKNNTDTMIKKWNAGSYGDIDERDIWGIIQEEVTKGWFIPSRGEWSAFAYNLEITPENCNSKGFVSWYWCSSIYNSSNAWGIAIYRGVMGSYGFEGKTCVRLSTTF